MSKYVMTPNGRRVLETTLEERIDKLIHIYELSCQSLIGQMPEYEKRGSGHYYKHRLHCYEQFVHELKAARGIKEENGNS